MVKQYVKRHPVLLRCVHTTRATIGRTAELLRSRGHSVWIPLVPVDDFLDCVQRLVRTLNSPGYVFGDYLEFGVSRGTSMMCVDKALRSQGLSEVRLIGFDSFEGLPDSAGEVEGWTPGQFHSTLRATRKYLRRNGVNLDRVELVRGWFSDTCTPSTVSRLHIERASIVMIDCDIYSASREALDFCAPVLAERSIIMFDDWGWRSDIDAIGQREAFEEFLREHPEFATEPLPAYLPQARVFLVTRR